MADNQTENKYAAQLQQARQQQAANQQESEGDADDSTDYPQGGGEKKHKISASQGMLMIIAALIADGLGALLAFFVITEPLNWLVWLYAVIGFYIWLKMLGISWMDAKGKRAMMIFGGATGIEFLPFVSALPAWTAFIVGAIINDRIEEAISSIPMGENILASMGADNKKNALDELNTKQSRTREENIKLVKARQIMKEGSISNNDLDDPVLKAAWEKHNDGVKEFDGVSGYRFDNTRYM